MKFIFLGTADFGILALKRLLDLGHSCVGVVTNPPKPSGRGLKLRKSQVHQFCDESLITPVLTPESLKSEEFLSKIKTLDADIFFVVAFSILPEVLFSIPPKGTFNIHAALLPKFRGPAPIQRAIEVGAKESGVTLFRIDRGVDTGNILVQLSCKIKHNDSTPTLYERLSSLGADAIEYGVKLIEGGDELYNTQDHSNATKAPLLKKSEGEINWSDGAELIYNRVRAFKPFPKVFTTINQKVHVIEWGEFRDSNQNSTTPGQILSISKEGIDIACGEGVFTITEIKPAGKRAMKVSDFINGVDLSEGTIIG